MLARCSLARLLQYALGALYDLGGARHAEGCFDVACEFYRPAAEHACHTWNRLSGQEGDENEGRDLPDMKQMGGE